MDVIGTIEMFDHPVDFTAIRVCSDGTISTAHDAVQAENLLSVYVNDILTMQLGCSVTNLAELVIGRLFTEGLISSADECFIALYTAPSLDSSINKSFCSA